MENKNYDIRAFCNNCDFDGSINVDFGVKISDFPCPKCGCKELEKYSEPITFETASNMEDYS